MIEFRRIVGKYTYIAFTQRREELMERRLEALKAKRMDEYAECLMQAGGEYNQCSFLITKLAGEFIDLDEDNYEASMTECTEDPETAAILAQNDEMVRTQVEAENEVAVSKEKAVMILLEKVQMDFEREEKMGHL